MNLVLWKQSLRLTDSYDQFLPTYTRRNPKKYTLKHSNLIRGCIVILIQTIYILTKPSYVLQWRKNSRKLEKTPKKLFYVNIAGNARIFW